MDEPLSPSVWQRRAARRPVTQFEWNGPPPYPASEGRRSACHAFRTTTLCALSALPFPHLRQALFLTVRFLPLLRLIHRDDGDSELLKFAQQLYVEHLA